jgi:hypothetical protein
MTRPSLAALTLLALSLSACGKPAATASAEPVPATAAAPAPAPSRRAPSVVQGLQLRDTGLHLVVYAGDSDVKFGTPMKAAVAAIDGMLGPGSKPETNSECGAGPITFVKWPDGLSGLFQDDKFQGWSVDSGSPKGVYVTDKAIGVGSTRAELLSAYPDAKIEESTLGTEFTVGDYDGMLSSKGADAKVETLWAGLSCVFR